MSDDVHSALLKALRDEYVRAHQELNEKDHSSLVLMVWAAYGLASYRCGNPNGDVLRGCENIQKLLGSPQPFKH